MKSCIFYTILLPLLYALLWYLMNHDLIPQALAATLGFLSFVLPSFVCCIGWLWVQRRRIRSIETPYICFILPLVFLCLANVLSVYIWGYDGFNTIFGHLLILLANVACCFGLVGLTWLLRLLWRIASALQQRKIRD